MSRGARIAGAIALWLGALVVGLYFTSSSDDSEDSAAAAAVTTTTASTTVVTTPSAETETTTTAPPTPTTAPPETTTTTSPPETTTTTTTAAPAVAGPAVEAALVGGRFSVSGTVPDDATATAIAQSAAIVYGPVIDNSLTVDGQVEAQPWLAGAPRAVTLLPIIGEGTLRLSEAGAVASGTAPNEAVLQAFSGAVEQAVGSAPEVSDVEITNLGFPSFNARRQGDQIALTGQLANEAVKANILAAARAVYGDAAVEDGITVGENLDIPFWNYTMPGVLQLFAPFPDYEINIENGVTSGSLNNGANFAVGSAELQPETVAILPIAVGILTRDPSLGIVIAGHTDSQGGTASNQRLSEARAQAVADWLIGAGVESARIVPVGFGETQPIASNATAAGRALNRRVEFRFGPLAALGG